MEKVDKRCRKMNWTQAEVNELRNSYLEFRSIIDGRLCISLTHYKKEQTWLRIQERINAQSGVERTTDEIKKKLSDIKSSLKKKERERRQAMLRTGGGPAPSLSDWDEKMIEAIGEVAVGGFCGVDTFNEVMETAATGCDTVKVTEVNDASTSNDVNRLKDDKKKTKSKSDAETAKLISLLEDQTETLKLILKEQKKTNEILGQLFSVNVPT